jgi:aminoglycoside 6'-N-acetyltransferase
VVTFRFRRATRSDFPILAEWLEQQHVRRWWNHEFTPAAVERDFGPSVDGTEPAADFIVIADGRPIGLIQFSRFVDYPDYVDEMEPVYPVDGGSASIDYLIGEPTMIGLGVGTAMIAAFADHVWANEPDTTHLVVPVNSRNVASWRALLGAGFRLVARGEIEPDHPDHDWTHEVLRIDRPAHDARRNR